MKSKLNDECTSGVMLTLFDQAAHRDSLNLLIMDALLGNLNQQKMVRLKELYKDTTFEGFDRPFMFNVTGTCTYNNKGIYSFIACPFNACDHAPRSNYETGRVTIDAATGRELRLTDIIDPAKMDTFSRLVLKFVTQYRVRNVPTCFISMSAPVEVKSANSALPMTDTVKYLPRLLPKFYLRDRFLVVYNKAEHRDFQFDCVELMLPLASAKPFLTPWFASKIDY